MTTPYQLFANLTNDEYDRLKADIALHGVRDPIELDDEGNVLDGHHRRAIADDLGITYPTVVREGWTEDQKRDHILAIHFGRRNLTTEQRREFIRQLKADQPTLTTREIAATVGVNHATVARDLTAVADATAVQPPDDRPERARALKAADPTLTQRTIATEVGASQASVTAWLNAPAKEAAKQADQIVRWEDLSGAMDSVEALARAEPDAVAMTVPGKRRATTARRLRAEGIALGRIALRLEQLSQGGER